MVIWIEVTNASGVRFGNGPITTATGWQSTRSLDGIGTFSFAMPAADPMAAHIANKRYVRCWAAGDDPTNPRDWPKDVGAGIIESITWSVERDVTMLQVSGVDLLSELAGVLVGDLKLFKDEVQIPDQVRIETGSITGSVWAPGDQVNLEPSPNLSYLYVRALEVFWRVSFTVGTPVQSTVAELEAQYYNRQAVSWDGIALEDGTLDAGKTWGKTGDIDFDPAFNWGDNAEPTPGYIVRFYKQSADLSPVQFTAITVTVRKPTLTALADVMALAPAGWTLDPTGFLETEADITTPTDRKGVYLQMAGESVLATLLAIAEQTGEHFILSPAGRRVKWLGKRKDASGLRILAPADPGSDPDDYTLYLRSLRRTRGSYDLITRLYVYGGGTGDTRVSLSGTDQVAPAGYTMDKVASWIQATDAVATYGRIEAENVYPNITAMDNSSASNTYAGNMLLQRAVEDLSRLCQLQDAYSLSLVPARYSLWPGQTVRLVYDEWVDSYHAMAIDDLLTVLDVGTQITENGEAETISLTVATVDVFPVLDGKRVAQAIVDGAKARSQSVPSEGLTNDFIGEVSGIRVRAGKVTNVTFREPSDVAPDGMYPSNPTIEALYAIEVKDGKVKWIHVRPI